jgi:hypothetical protein
MGRTCITNKYEQQQTAAKTYVEAGYKENDEQKLGKAMDRVSSSTTGQQEQSSSPGGNKGRQIASTRGVK